MVDHFDEEYNALRYNRDSILDALIEETQTGIFLNDTEQLFSKLAVSYKTIGEIFEV